ncbi:hypothetical protein TGPRC2_425650 [Toxoplasma gondii TgCatPRC2]|uniref:Uncharacterized protein n=1 Tax=Toxoplasma gondii TgCatPRC2 TaxID=1130821 RepID=A0A151H9Z2_TOXGO|nr:hypothetical protein TGPRC2_425650 [Toxoplasma gondii TgCatPRC2]
MNDAGVCRRSYSNSLLFSASGTLSKAHLVYDVFFTRKGQEREFFSLSVSPVSTFPQNGRCRCFRCANERPCLCALTQRSRRRRDIWGRGFFCFRPFGHMFSTVSWRKSREKGGGVTSHSPFDGLSQLPPTYGEPSPGCSRCRQRRGDLRAGGSCRQGKSRIRKCPSRDMQSVVNTNIFYHQERRRSLRNC